MYRQGTKQITYAVIKYICDHVECFITKQRRAQHNILLTLRLISSYITNNGVESLEMKFEM